MVCSATRAQCDPREYFISPIVLSRLDEELRTSREQLLATRRRLTLSERANKRVATERDDYRLRAEEQAAAASGTLEQLSRAAEEREYFKSKCGLLAEQLGLAREASPGAHVRRACGMPRLVAFFLSRRASRHVPCNVQRGERHTTQSHETRRLRTPLLLALAPTRASSVECDPTARRFRCPRPTLGALGLRTHPPALTARCPLAPMRPRAHWHCM